MTQRNHLTDKSIEKLPAHDPHSRSRSKAYSDPECSGLRLEVSKSGDKTFYFSLTRGGQKHTMRVGSFPGIKIKEARTMAASIKAEIEQRGMPVFLQKQIHAAVRFQDFALEQYLPFAYETKRSAKDDESKIRMHLLPAFGHKYLAEITRREVETYCNQIRKSHCDSTANRHLSLVARMFKKAVDWSVIETNPAQGIKKFKENNVMMDYLKPDEIARLFAVMEDDENWVAVLAIKFLLFTGLRKNEALLAEWVNVNMEQKSLFLPQTKSGRGRHVPLSDLAWDVIVALKAKATGRFVFPGRDPNLPYNNLMKPFQRYLKRAGLPHFRLHSARHTFASLLVTNGASLFAVQNLLGHASPVMTQRYSHLNNQLLRDTSQLIGTALQQTIPSTTA